MKMTKFVYYENNVLTFSAEVGYDADSYLEGFLAGLEASMPDFDEDNLLIENPTEAEDYYKIHYSM